MKLKEFEICREKDGCLPKHHFSEILFSWGKKISRKAEGEALAFRYGLGFIITASGSNLQKLSEADLIHVKNMDLKSRKITICGKGELPESVLLHAIVFENRSGAIFSFLISGRASPGIPVIENADDLEKKLGTGNCFLLKNQGILSFGCTADDAGGLLV